MATLGSFLEERMSEKRMIVAVLALLTGLRIAAGEALPDPAKGAGTTVYVEGR